MKEAPKTFPRASAVNCRRIGALIYRMGPLTREAIVKHLGLGGNERKEFLKSITRMGASGQLIFTRAGFDIPREFRDRWAVVAGFAKPAPARDSFAMQSARYQGEIVPPRTPSFKPLDLDKYRYLRTDAASARSFVSMSSRVRTPLDVMGEV